MPFLRWFRRRPETARFDSAPDGNQVFSVTTRLRGTILVATVEGRIDRKTVDRLEGAVTIGLSGRETRSIVLDMQNVTIILSAGLNFLLALGRQASGRGGSLALVVGDDVIAQILAVSGFDKVFPVFDQLEDAIAALSGGAK